MKPITGPATVTHARLRASQGDLRGARRVVRAVLVLRPQDPEAQRLLAELERRAAATSRATPVGRPDGAERTRAGARVERLRRWLDRIEGSA